MEFYQLLDNYIKEIGCSAKDLAAESHVSASVISRYRSGERAPSADSSILKKLAQGLSKLSGQNDTLIYSQMITCLTSRASFAKQAFYKIDRLVSELYIKQADIARTFNYDASFISRVLSGQRFPSNVEGFLEDIARYVSQNCDTAEHIEILSSIIFVSPSELNTEDERFQAVLNWMIYDETPTINFLNMLDSFDYNDFLTAVHFSDIKIPNEPLSIPATHLYIGKNEMKQGELDFMKIAALSRSTDDVYLYSDMTMQDMLDSDFPRLYMTGLAILVKKGLHLRVIHNLDRPLDEMMVGLEAWIPLYMTGQISPYYFDGYSDKYFNHLLYSSGSVSLYGSSLYGQRERGHYYLTKKADEVAYLYERAKHMVEMASPLMQIFRSSEREAFYIQLEDTLSSSTNFRSILSSPPLSTLSNETMEKIVRNYAIMRNLSKERLAEILKQVRRSMKQEKTLLQNQVKSKDLHISFHILSKEEFEESPVYLPLGIGFTDINIPYTYETYLQHIQEDKEFVKKHPNIIIEERETPGFKNIQIRMGNNGKPWVLISKSLSPSIHFMIKHPLLVNAISKIEFPITDVK